MSLTQDVVNNAIAIANDNRFRYHYSYEGNGSGAVNVPYTMDCCTFISYAIYLAMEWTWYNQPYSYYWPHVSQSGYDYFLTNTIGCSKQLWHSVSDRRAGDIIITDEYYGHTLMLVNENQIIDAVPCSNYGVAQSIAIRAYPHYDTAHFLYLYRFPDSGTADYIYNDDRGSFTNGAHAGVSYSWNTTELPYKCTVNGTATANSRWSQWEQNISNSPFKAGTTYNLKYDGKGVVQLRAYFYLNGSSSYSESWGTYTDKNFTIPVGCTYLIFELFVENGQTANNIIVTPEMNEVPKPLPDIPPITPTNVKTGMPVWMMLNPFL